MNLDRFLFHHKCTVGLIEVPDLTVYTLEPPWLLNQKDVSCVPVGEYGLMPLVDDPKGHLWRLTATAPRVDIDIHVGNYPRDTLGCILVGLDFHADHAAVELASSDMAMQALNRYLLHSGDRELIIQHIE